MTEKLPPLVSGKAASVVPVPFGVPWLRLAFRPFYLGAALLAALIVPLWTSIFLGGISWQPTPPALLWHAHEMLFGFAIAVIVGFLMTAGKSWTGLATPRGPVLGGLFLLWLSARVASWVAPYMVFAVLDLAQLPAVGLIFLRLLVKSRNWRNVPLALILLLLSAVNLGFHLAANGMVAVSPMQCLYAGLAFVVVVECVMAGRVLPFFTSNALTGVKIVAIPWLDWMALAVTGLGLVLWVANGPAGVTTAALGLACVLHLVRQSRWHLLATLKLPLVWILQLSHLWLSLGLGLLALAQMGWVPVSLGVHALGVGATGGLIIGMMTRTARGHTGRDLTAGAAEIAAFGLVMTAALLRVLLPLLVPTLYNLAIAGAAVAWSLAFLIFLWQYTPWLVSSRPDGKDG